VGALRTKKVNGCVGPSTCNHPSLSVRNGLPKLRADQRKYGVSPAIRPDRHATAPFQVAVLKKGSSKSTPTELREPNRIRTHDARATPAQKNRRSDGFQVALSRSQKLRVMSVKAGESVSRLLPVMSLSNPSGKMPTKNGPRASKELARSAARRPTERRPARKRYTGANAFRRAAPIQAP